MTRPVGVFLTRRQSGGCPHHAAVLVTQINDLRLRIGNRVIVPGRQPVVWLLPNHGAAQTTLAHHGSELRVGHYVDPGRWGGYARLEINRVFPAIGRESAEPVEVRQFKERQGRRRFFRSAAGWNERRQRDTLPTAASCC